MLERLNQAMEHIERHLDQEIEVKELARIAFTSEYHFRRLFSALAGIPLSEYVRRRLTLAGAEVLAGERTLLEIAVRHGYGSGEAFARAFRTVHGKRIPPRAGRRTGRLPGRHRGARQLRPAGRRLVLVRHPAGLSRRLVERTGDRGLRSSLPTRGSRRTRSSPP